VKKNQKLKKKPDSTKSKPKPVAVLGVSGGIAAYKAVEVCRQLTKSGFHVVPVLTSSALKMVGKKTFDALASEPTKTDMWNDADPSPHTYLGQLADVIVVCPATARIIADIRVGRSGDLLSATILATTAPLVVCPAMHTEMWEQPAVQENIEVLIGRGVTIVPPGVGDLAGGDSGVGRLAEAQKIVEAVDAAIYSTKPLSGKKVLVTAGGTREAIDSVRYISNRSTGKQGHGFAEVAHKLGADVTLITASSLRSNKFIKRIDVVAAADMATAVSDEFQNTDILIMAAAVADFRPETVSKSKLKKSDGIPTIKLIPTTDILLEVSKQKKPDQIVVGFAAETDDLEKNSKKKLAEKNLDYIIANDILADGAGFAYDTNTVTVFGSDGSQVHLPLANKNDIAKSVFDLVVNPD